MDHYRFLEALRLIDQQKAARAGTPTLAPTDASPQDAATWHAAALAHQQEGKADAALAAWEQALSCAIDDLELLDAIGQGLRAIGQDPLVLMERLQAQSPGSAAPVHHPQAPEWQAVCMAVLRGDWHSALPALEAEQASRPGSQRRTRNLALALRRLGQDGRAQCVLAAAMVAREEWRQAADAFLAAPEADAQDPDFLTMMIKALRHSGRETRALAIAEAATARGSCAAAARIQWAEALMDLGREQDALAVLREGASALDDWWLRLQAGLILPPVPDSQNAVEQADARVHRFIRELQRLRLPTEPDQLAALEQVLEPNFYLGYRGQPDVATVRDFGRFVARVVAARFPEYSQPLPRLPIGNRKIRIGYAARYVMHHTVTRHFAGWFSHADPTHFEIHLFPITKHQDWMSVYLHGHVDVCHPATEEIEAVARAIRGANLDLLVHVAIGMDPLTMRLAAMRLAPLQCVAWGHPVSTGLPNVDYFISADGMEPGDGNEHYTERLVTLPGTGAALSNVTLPEKFASRAELGLPEQGPVYVSPQSLFKYLPSHDDLYARIAREVGDAVFVFIESDMPAWTRSFRVRIEASFRALGLESDDHLVFLPWQSLEGFLATLHRSDVMLDTLDWSGGQTSYDALACGLPIVTLPGRMMRGRQTCGMLTRIGVEDTIASDSEDYVRIAVRLGKDRAWRDDVARRVRERSYLLYNDVRPVHALEAFYRWAVGAAQPGDADLFKLWPPGPSDPP